MLPLQLSNNDLFRRYNNDISTNHIKESQLRCLNRGLKRDDLCFTSPVELTNSSAVSAKEFEACESLRDVFDALPDDRVMMFITDKTGIVLCLHSSKHLLDYTKNNFNLGIGSSFSEDDIGTNAISLCLKTLKPEVVCGKQHYSKVLRNWITLAHPLDDNASSQPMFLGIAIFESCEINDYHMLLRLSSLVVKNKFSKHQIPSEGTGTLTKRQLEVLKAYAQGCTYKEIAKLLGLKSFKTVEDHLEAIKSRLSADSRRECIRIAMDQEILKD